MNNGEISKHGELLHSRQNFEIVCGNWIQIENEKFFDQMKDWIGEKNVSIVQDDSLTKKMAYFQSLNTKFFQV